MLHKHKHATCKPFFRLLASNCGTNYLEDLFVKFALINNLYFNFLFNYYVISFLLICIFNHIVDIVKRYEELVGLALYNAYYYYCIKGAAIEVLETVGRDQTY